MTNYYEALATLLTTKDFEVDAAAIHPQATLKELGMDSLAIVDLVIALQKDYRVPLDETKDAGGLTVGALADLLETVQGQATPE
jgi:acyl carrier protein